MSELEEGDAYPSGPREPRKPRGKAPSFQPSSAAKKVSTIRDQGGRRADVYVDFDAFIDRAFQMRFSSGGVYLIFKKMRSLDDAVMKTAIGKAVNDLQNNAATNLDKIYVMAGKAATNEGVATLPDEPPDISEPMEVDTAGPGSLSSKTPTNSPSLTPTPKKRVLQPKGVDLGKKSGEGGGGGGGGGGSLVDALLKGKKKEEEEEEEKKKKKREELNKTKNKTTTSTTKKNEGNAKKPSNKGDQEAKEAFDKSNVASDKAANLFLQSASPTEAQNSMLNLSLNRAGRSVMMNKLAKVHLNGKDMRMAHNQGPDVRSDMEELYKLNKALARELNLGEDQDPTPEQINQHGTDRHKELIMDSEVDRLDAQLERELPDKLRALNRDPNEPFHLKHVREFGTPRHKLVKAAEYVTNIFRDSFEFAQFVGTIDDEKVYAYLWDEVQKEFYYNIPAAGGYSMFKDFVELYRDSKLLLPTVRENELLKRRQDRAAEKILKNIVKEKGGGHDEGASSSSSTTTNKSPNTNMFLYD